MPERRRRAAGKTALLGLATAVLACAMTVEAFAADGALETGFGVAGHVTTAVGPWGDSANAVAVQPGGKIVAVGATQSVSGKEFALVRYSDDGSVDSAFGTSGVVTTSFGPGDDVANAVAIQSDGKIVDAGSAGSPATFAVARYTAGGILDSTFGSSGVTTTTVSPQASAANAVAIQSDGKIVAAGTRRVGGGTCWNSEFVLVRHNGNGSLDTTFGSGGMVTTAFGTPGCGSDGNASAVLIQSDGKIVAAGWDSSGFAVARYNANGSLDTSFGSGGKVSTGFGLLGWAAALQPDGKVVVAGSAPQGSSGHVDFAVARFLNDGSFDNSFDSDGRLTTDFSGSNDEVHSVVIQSDGKIIAVGGAVVGGRMFALARYDTDGSLDPSFGDGGKVTTGFGGAAYGYAAAAEPGARIVVAGAAFVNGSGDDFALARYAEDATPPETSINSGPAGTADVSVASFVFSSSEVASSFSCQLDAGAWAGCASPSAFSGFADGPHTFQVRATDAVGNTDPSPASWTWTVDTAGYGCTVSGTSGNDVLTGTSGVDIICGMGGDDQINAKAGNDVVYAGAGNDLVVGDAGDDTLYGEAGIDTLKGRAGNDALDGGSGRDSASYQNAPSGVSVDLVAGAAMGEGVDTLTAVEDLDGSIYDDSLIGDAGPNTIWGWGGVDTIYGGGGDDVVNGNRGDDALYGESGNDMLVGSLGNDAMDGGTGSDLAEYQNASGPVTVDLVAGTATGDGSDSLAAIEGADGSNFADSIAGDAGANILRGWGGNDMIHGGFGNDWLEGNTGDDVLYGEAGYDILYGLAGTDICYDPQNTWFGACEAFNP